MLLSDELTSPSSSSSSEDATSASPAPSGETNHAGLVKLGASWGVFPHYLNLAVVNPWHPVAFSHPMQGLAAPAARDAQHVNSMSYLFGTSSTRAQREPVVFWLFFVVQLRHCIENGGSDELDQPPSIIRLDLCVCFCQARPFNLALLLPGSTVNSINFSIWRSIAPSGNPQSAILPANAEKTNEDKPFIKRVSSLGVAFDKPRHPSLCPRHIGSSGPLIGLIGRRDPSPRRDDEHSMDNLSSRRSCITNFVVVCLSTSMGSADD